MDGDELTGAQRALAEEACRIVGRLDRLDGILAGEPGEWMRFRSNGDGTEVTVTLDRALAEARAQAVALKQIVAELRQSAAKVVAPSKPEGGSDDLAARRAARRTAAGL